MNRYVNPIPRSVFGIAAVLVTVSIFALSVVLPAQVAPNSQKALASAPTNDLTKAPIEVTLSPASIEVIGFREQKTAQDPGRNVLPKQKHAGGGLPS